MDIDAALAVAGQDFSNSFQIRFGQHGFIPFPSDGLVIDNIRLGTCSKPIAQNVMHISPTSVTLSWTEIGTATSRNVEWGVKGFIPSTGNLIQNISSTAYDLSNLALNTSYDFYVQSLCDDTSSIWVGPYTFTTFCATPSPVTLPFLEDFENILDTLFTENVQICNEHSNWSYQTNGGRAHFGTSAQRNNGGNGALLLDNNFSYSTNNAILTLDMSNYISANDIILTFDAYHPSNPVSDNNSIQIRGNSAEEWIVLYNWQVQTNGVWYTSPELDIDSVLTGSGQEFSSSFQIKFGQEGYFIFPIDGLVIDNIQIDNCSTSQADVCDCMLHVPTDVFVSNNIEGNTRIKDYTYLSNDELLSNGTIKPNSTVIFKARQAITLSPGFEAYSGSDFQAILEPCTNVSDNTIESIATNREVKNQVSNLENAEKLTAKNPIEMRISPNLVQTTSTIEIDLPTLANISLALYNVSGQKIKNYLSNKSLRTGTHQIQFERKNLPTGIYFWQLSSNQEIIMKKMMIQ